MQPIDLVKVRLQLAGEGSAGAARPGPVAVAKGIVAKEGVAALWSGLSAAYTRQIVYGSARLGLFRTFSNMAKERYQGQSLPLSVKIACGLSAGALASAIGNPAEVALIRMQADSTLPAAQRRNYTGVVDALSRIARTEGIAGLWSGASPTVFRAMTLNAAMLATADQAKESLGPFLGGQSSYATAITSAFISGVAASVASLPADLIKTRLQKQMPNPVTGKLPYAGLVDCARQIAAKEGLASFYTGLTTYIFRIAPHAFITLLALDGLNSMYRKRKEAAAPPPPSTR